MKAVRKEIIKILNLSLYTVLMFKNKLPNCRFPHGVFIQTPLADSLGSPASVYLPVQSSSPSLHSTAAPILTLESFFFCPILVFTYIFSYLDTHIYQLLDFMCGLAGEGKQNKTIKT